MATETILDCGLSLSPQEKGILRKFPFKCPECRCDSFYQKSEDFIVCAHCRHIWTLTIINPSRRDCHQDAELVSVFMRKKELLYSKWQRRSN